MTSLVNKSADWTPNYHKILIFSATKSLKSLCAARIDELADSNEPAIMLSVADPGFPRVESQPYRGVNLLLLGNIVDREGGTSKILPQLYADLPLDVNISIDPIEGLGNMLYVSMSFHDFFFMVFNLV